MLRKKIEDAADGPGGLCARVRPAVVCAGLSAHVCAAARHPLCKKSKMWETQFRFKCSIVGRGRASRRRRS